MLVKACSDIIFAAISCSARQFSLAVCLFIVRVVVCTQVSFSSIRSSHTSSVIVWVRIVLKITVCVTDNLSRSHLQSQVNKYM